MLINLIAIAEAITKGLWPLFFVLGASNILREPDLLLVITGTNMAYTRPDGVKVFPIGCLKDQKRWLNEEKHCKKCFIVPLEILTKCKIMKSTYYLYNSPILYAIIGEMGE